MHHHTQTKRFDVVIIGAGAAGLYMLHQARGLGMSAVVIERAPSVGGTWYWNRYPGLHCDVESLDYSYSFDEELQREWRWTEKYASQEEILAYLNHVADRFELRDGIDLGVEVLATEFDEAAGAWQIHTDHGDYVGTYLVACTGPLSTPKEPDLPGLDSFSGPIIRSTDWPEAGFDFAGKSVAVIGTGSTGIQLTPIIGEQAKELYVLQRTPSYTVPARHRQLDDAEYASEVEHYATRRRLKRSSLLGIDTHNEDRATFDVTPAEQQAAYQANYDYGSPMRLLTTFNDPILVPAANDVVREFIAETIRERVGDPELAARFVPDYAVGSRRLCIDTDFYETFRKPNVHLVDLRETPLVRFTETGFETTAGEQQIDVVVLALGYDALTGTLSKLDPKGRDGLSLRAKWHEYPASYLGVMVAGFPNLFMVNGPQSPSVNSNMFATIEQHVEFITDLLATAQDRGASLVEATDEAEAEWVQHSAEIAELTVFPSADSWYLGSNIPGKPRAIQLYLGGVGGFQQRLDEVQADGYRGFAVSAAEHAGGNER